MPLHEYTPGIRIPIAYEPANPIPVDALSGPYSAGTTTAAIALALATIPSALRFLSMEVRILAPNPAVGGQTLAYKYWFRGNTGTLEEFSSGGGGDVTLAGTNVFTALNSFNAGISSAGATFTGLVRAYNGISAAGTATFTGNVVLGNESTDTITATGTFQGITVSTRTAIFNAGLSAASDSYVESLIVGQGGIGQMVVSSPVSNFNRNVRVVGGLSAEGDFISGSIDSVGGITYTRAFIPVGTSLGQGISFAVLGNAAFNGNVIIGPSGGQVAPGTTQGVLYVRTGTTFERAVNFSAGLTSAGKINSSAGFVGTLTGNASTATRLENARAINGTNFDGTADITTANWGSSRDITIGATTRTVNGSANYSWSLSDIGAAGTGVANTFSQLQTFNAGITSSSVYATTLTTRQDANIGGTLTVDGNFFVQGTITTVNRVDLEIDDKLIVLGRTLDNIDSVIDGAGIWLGASGAAQAANSTRYLLWRQTPQAWESGTNFNVTSGYGYKINGITALDAGQIHGLSVSNAIVSAGTWQGNPIGLQYGGFGDNISGITTGAILWKTSTGITGTANAGTSGQLLQSQGSFGPNFISPSSLTGLTAESINADTGGNFTSSAFHGIVFINPSGTPRRAYVSTTDLNWVPTTLTLTVGSGGTGKIEATIDGGTW